MSFSPPAAVEAATVWLLRGHTTDDDRGSVVVITIQGPRRSTSIGIVIVRRRAAHIVQIVKDGQFYPALSACGCTTTSSGMSAFVTLPTALLVVVRVLPPFLLALLLLTAAPPPIVAVLVMRPLVISAASSTGQSAVSACQIVRHDTY